MALTVTTVNGGQARVVLGANGRPAHVIELGPLYLRVDLSGGFATLPFAGIGGYAITMFALPASVWPVFQQRQYRAMATQIEARGLTLEALGNPPPGEQSFPQSLPHTLRTAAARRVALGASVPSPSEGLERGIPA